MTRTREEVWTGPRSFAEVLQQAGLAALIGLGIGFLFWIADMETPILRLLAMSVLIGLSIYLAVSLLMLLFCRSLGRLPDRRRKAGLAALFFVAGASGWGFAIAAAPYLTFGWLRPGIGNWAVALAFAGSLAVVIGLLCYSYEVLRARLQESTARLKEGEFAEKELQNARAIQRRLLPPAEVEGESYRIAARNLPARYVAGDFFDIFHLADGSLGFAVADVAGKGMGASLIVASVKAMLPLLATERSVEETLRELNRRLARELAPREFVALCLVRYRPDDGSFEAANAGLPDPYLVAAAPGERPRPLQVPGPRLPLGVRLEVPYEAAAGRLGWGEKLCLLTDGLPEAETRAGEPLGYERLEEVLGQAAGPAPSWLGAVLGAVEAESAPERGDDLTALVIERVRAADLGGAAPAAQAR